MDRPMVAFRLAGIALASLTLTCAAPDDGDEPATPTTTEAPLAAPGRIDPRVLDEVDANGRVRVFVRFAHGADRKSAFGLLKGAGGRVTYEYRMLPDLVAVRDLPASALNGLSQALGVKEILPVGTRQANLTESLAVMHATPAELAGYSNGAGVRVCILDTGINKTHSAFPPGTVVAEKDFVNLDNDATDDEGHGSHVAGIIASRDATYR